MIEKRAFNNKNILNMKGDQVVNNEKEAYRIIKLEKQLLGKSFIIRNIETQEKFIVFRSVGGIYISIKPLLESDNDESRY